jgi:hypothetical protein
LREETANMKDMYFGDVINNADILQKDPGPLTQLRQQSAAERNSESETADQPHIAQILRASPVIPAQRYADAPDIANDGASQTLR